MSQAHKEQKNMSGKVAGLDPLMVRVAGLQMIWSLKDQRDLKMSSELSSVFHLDFSHLSLHIPSPPLVAHGCPWFPTAPMTAPLRCLLLVRPWHFASPHRHRCSSQLQHVLPSIGHRHVAMSPCRHPRTPSLHLVKNDSDLSNCPLRMVEACCYNSFLILGTTMNSGWVILN